MAKKIIRLTESDIHRIVEESVNRILSEDGLTNRQIRNITGIYDDDELNAAVMEEDADDLASSIIKDLRDEYNFYNIYDKHTVLDFGFLKNLLNKKYNMKYLGYDENDESHSFGNNKFKVEFWTKENYPNLNKFHLANMHVSGRMFEEVDLGQVDAMRDRQNKAKEFPVEAKKEIRRLRHLIDDYSKQGKDTKALTDRIKKIKAEL
jgi:hypothetical protein